MLDNAKKYEQEIQDKFFDTWYDMKYQYYRDTSGDRIPQLPDNCYDRRSFVSLDKEGKVIGFISYSYNDTTGGANSFGIINFGKPSYTFANDVLQVVADIFFKYKLNRIEWWCFADNPAIKGYRKFIKRFGGREVGHLREVSRLMDGKLHDGVIFEILREDLVKRVIGPLTILCNIVVPELAYQTGYDDEQFQEDWNIDEIIETDESMWANIPNEIWEEATKYKTVRERERRLREEIIHEKN